MITLSKSSSNDGLLFFPNWSEEPRSISLQGGIILFATQLGLRSFLLMTWPQDFQFCNRFFLPL